MDEKKKRPAWLAVVRQLCRDHPEWGASAGARNNWSAANQDPAGVAVAEALWRAGHPASHIYDEDWFGDGSCVVHGGVLVGDLVVDVTARRWDERLPFPLVVPLHEWERLVRLAGVA